jgi:hypothetical protein
LNFGSGLSSTTEAPVRFSDEPEPVTRDGAARERWRALALVLATGVAAGLFVAWPGFSIDRDGDWRKILAGFQLQKETGDFIGAERALIHAHGLDGRAGEIHFRLAPRVQGDVAEVDVKGPAGVQHVVVGTSPVDVSVPFGELTDVEVSIDATSATNPRPIVMSELRVKRGFSWATFLLCLLPLILGALAYAVLSPSDLPRGGAPAAAFVVVATAFLIVNACDPVRALSFPTGVTESTPLALCVGFAVLNLSGSGLRSVAIALAGIVASLHISTTRSGFVYDDRLWARPWTLAELASTFVGSEDPLGISGEQYRPIPSLTHALDHALWGASPFAFHVMNMALHWLSALLLFFLLKRVGIPRAAAFLGALTLAAHPLAASSVGWISERTDTQADIFMLATLIVFLGPKGTQAVRVLGIALLALWSKETSVMLPALAGLFAWAALAKDEIRARFGTLRALVGLVVLYVAVWVSLFPEKTVGRLQVTAATLQSEQSGWLALFGSLFGQMFHPIGFESWRATRESLPQGLWVAVALSVIAAAGFMSFRDSTRAVAWRMIAVGLTWSALVVLPFRGHDGVDVYRLGHTPVIGFSILVAGVAMLLVGLSQWRAIAVALVLLFRFGPVSTETSAAWGYPGFQFRMALRFNLENPTFLGGLTAEMRRDLERESLLEAHRDDPLKTPFRE